MGCIHSCRRRSGSFATLSASTGVKYSPAGESQRDANYTDYAESRSGIVEDNNNNAGIMSGATNAAIQSALHAGGSNEATSHRVNGSLVSNGGPDSPDGETGQPIVQDTQASLEHVHLLDHKPGPGPSLSHSAQPLGQLLKPRSRAPISLVDHLPIDDADAGSQHRLTINSERITALHNLAQLANVQNLDKNA